MYRKLADWQSRSSYPGFLLKSAPSERPTTMPTQVTGKPVCMYDRCKGKVTTFVDGVPVCAGHREHAIKNAAPDVRIDEAGDWVLKAPGQIKMPDPIVVYDSEEHGDDDETDTPDAYCMLCAFEDDALVAATHVHKGKHVCDQHFLKLTTKKGSKLAKRKADPKALVEAPIVELKPRRIRLPEDD